MARTKKQTATEPLQAVAQEEQTTLTGRLCADPQLRHTASGKAVTTIRIAVHHQDSETTFHSVVVWGRTAEVVSKYLRKGRLVEVNGRPQQRTFEAADGNQRTVDEIVAWRVQFVPRQPAAAAADSEQEVAS